MIKEIVNRLKTTFALLLKRVKIADVMRTPHLWTIVLILAGITFIYYYLIFPYAEPQISPWLTSFAIFEFSYRINGSLYIIPFLYTLVVFGYRGALVIWVASMVVIAPRIARLTFDNVALFINIVLALTPLLATLFVTSYMESRKKEGIRLAESEAERMAYMSHILRVQDDERRRIAEELHDDTLQVLSAIAKRAETLLFYDCSKTTPEMIEHAEWIRGSALRGVDDLRRFCLDLRPGILDDLGLLPALRWLADRLRDDASISVKMVVEGESRRLNPQIESHIFRLVQEALSNIRRHSRATEAHITLEFAPELLRVAVQDNGVGFSLPETFSSYASAGKLGLIGMKERIQLLNGTFKIVSELGKGTAVLFKLSVNSLPPG